MTLMQNTCELGVKGVSYFSEGLARVSSDEGTTSFDPDNKNF